MFGPAPELPPLPAQRIVVTQGRLDRRDPCIFISLPEDPQVAIAEQPLQQVAVGEPRRRERGRKVLAANNLRINRESGRAGLPPEIQDEDRVVQGVCQVRQRAGRRFNTYRRDGVAPVIPGGEHRREVLAGYRELLLPGGKRAFLSSSPGGRNLRGVVVPQQHAGRIHPDRDPAGVRESGEPLLLVAADPERRREQPDDSGSGRVVKGRAELPDRYIAPRCHHAVEAKDEELTHGDPPRNPEPLATSPRRRERSYRSRRRCTSRTRHPSYRGSPSGP